ncbi:uncharacterized protein [Aristolochia californica]|uniref:uncharacterized protein n=1 Tax=Aristolochia californica TaxID=171875 RepID=UPI0035DDC11F
MTSQDKLLLHEGQSANRPPLFNGVNYRYWKVRMKFFLKSMDWDIWHGTKNDPFEAQKDFIELTRDDMEPLKTNSKDINLLLYALGPNMFNRVSTRKIAKEIWDKLEVTHDGTTRVKDSRIALLIAQCNEFKMKLSEAIAEMNSRFTHIINELNILGDEISLYRQNDKLLLALPKSWDMRKTAIHENDNFRTLSSEELLGILLTYEMKPQEVDED